MPGANSTGPHDRIREAVDLLLDDLVDPRDALIGDDGTFWHPIGTGAERREAVALGSEQELFEVQRQCRLLAATNEWAINAVENRVSYVVGEGHTYRAAARPAGGGNAGSSVDDLVARVQDVVDEWRDRERWDERQAELLRRSDRDGEAYLRVVPQGRGRCTLRAVEPEQIQRPGTWSADSRGSWGVLSADGDAESVEGYFIDGVLVPAVGANGHRVLRRRMNVDRNVKRGLPTFFPVRRNLRRAEKLLRNMSVVAEVQSAIALIRKHPTLTAAGISSLKASQTDAEHTHAQTGRVSRYTQYGPGTILDVAAGYDYDFPAHALDAGAYVDVLRAELRSIASRLVMPEYMLSSDLGGANFSSALVAETPALKMFLRLQRQQIREDRAVLDSVIDIAVRGGLLPRNVRELVEIQIRGAQLHTRDPIKQARVEKIAYEAGILSPQSWCDRMGLDYAEEQAAWARHETSALQPDPPVSSGRGAGAGVTPGSGGERDPQPREF